MAGEKRGSKDSKKLKNFLKKNRGLSTIIITLILIVIILVAVGLLWGPIKRFIQGNIEMTEIQNQFFNEQLVIISFNLNEPFVNVTVRKPGGEIKSSTVNLTVEQSIEVDIFSVVDLSGSMRECYGINSSQCASIQGNWNSPICDTLNNVSKQSQCISYGGTWNDKLTATQNANKDMINNILNKENNRIGLIGYRNIAINSNSTNLTNNAVLLNTVINSWQVASSTCICCGINNASLRFGQQSTPAKMKSMIIMSDGDANVQCTQQNTGNSKLDAIKAACDANSSLNNLKIYSIGVVGADEATLTSIANCGGGKYYNVTNTNELIGTYQTIVQQIEERSRSINALNYLYFVFYNRTSFYREKVTDLPGILETKTYNFNLMGKLAGEIIKIEIYPVVISSSNKEIIGPMLAFWEA